MVDFSKYYSLGLDISPRNCGLYLLSFDFEEKIPKYLDLGSVGDGWENSDALWVLFSGLFSFCSDYDIKVAVIEGYAFNRPQGAAASGERSGIVKLVVSRFLKHRPKFLVIPPRTLKLFATGYGTADKKDIKAVLDRWEFPFGTEHEADAGVLAKIGVYYSRNCKTLTDYQKGIITNLRRDNGIFS